jgi:WD40 repeat protein
VGGFACDPADASRAYYVAGGNVVSAPLKTVGQQGFLRGHDGDITCMAVSNSGRYMATGQAGVNADVRVWDLVTGECVHVLSEHDEGVACVAFSADDRLIASCGVPSDGKLFVWDVETGGIVANGPCEPRDAKAVAFSPVVVSGIFYTFACAGADVVVYGVDAAEGKMGGQKCGVGHTKRQYCSAIFDDDGERLHCGSTSGDVASFGTAGCVLRALAPCCKGGALVLAKDPTEEGRFLVGGGDGTVSVFNPLRPPTVLDALDHVWKLKGAVTSLSFVDGEGGVTDGDGNRIVDRVVACTSEGMKYLCPTRKRLHDARAAQNSSKNGSDPSTEPLLLEESHVAPVKLVKFAPENAVFGAKNANANGDGIGSCVSASSDGALRGWTLDPRPNALMRAGLRTGAKPLCVAPTTSTTMTGWDDGNVRCHSNATGELLWTLPDAHVGGVSAIGVAVGQHFFVTGGVKGEVRVWDSRSRRLISTLKEHCQAVVGVECLGDDVHVVSASRDRSIITWDLVHERRVAQHTQRVGSINAFELFRADGRDATRMVSVGQDRSLSFWDLMEDRALQVVPGAHAQECTCASLSPHGVLATGSKDQSVKLWDFETGALLAAEHAHCEAVRAVAFSHDGSTLVSGGDDGIVMVWNVQVAA